MLYHIDIFDCDCSKFVIFLPILLASEEQKNYLLGLFGFIGTFGYHIGNLQVY
jgi:hypothetical protein